MPKIVLDRWKYGKELFLALCNEHGIHPHGWGSLEQLLVPQYHVGFRRVLWNHKKRRFYVQPKLHTWRTLIDPSSIFTDQLECEAAAIDELGYILDDSFTDDGAALESVWAFLSPGHTYDLMQPVKTVL